MTKIIATTLTAGALAVSLTLAAMADGYAPIHESDLTGNWAESGSHVDFTPQHGNFKMKGYQ